MIDNGEKGKRLRQSNKIKRIDVWLRRHGHQYGPYLWLNCNFKGLKYQLERDN